MFGVFISTGICRALVRERYAKNFFVWRKCDVKHKNYSCLLEVLWLVHSLWCLDNDCLQGCLLQTSIEMNLFGLTRPIVTPASPHNSEGQQIYKPSPELFYHQPM